MDSKFAWGPDERCKCTSVAASCVQIVHRNLRLETEGLQALIIFKNNQTLHFDDFITSKNGGPDDHCDPTIVAGTVAKPYTSHPLPLYITPMAS